MYRKNTIKGQKPEFGNPEHIKFVKEGSDKLAGKLAVCSLEWEPVKWNGQKNETRKPITYHSTWKNCDAVQCYIPCPRCNKMHKHVVCYDQNNVLQIEQWAAIHEAENACWNCGLQFEIPEDGSFGVFVKTVNN